MVVDGRMDPLTRVQHWIAQVAGAVLDQWIYWIAPLVGAGLGWALYKAITTPATDER